MAWVLGNVVKLAGDGIDLSLVLPSATYQDVQFVDSQQELAVLADALVDARQERIGKPVVIVE